jgi:hypothetical protein
MGPYACTTYDLSSSSNILYCTCGFELREQVDIPSPFDYLENLLFEDPVDMNMKHITLEGKIPKTVQ